MATDEECLEMFLDTALTSLDIEAILKDKFLVCCHPLKFDIRHRETWTVYQNAYDVLCKDIYICI